MAHRIEVIYNIPDSRSAVKKRYLEDVGFSGKIDKIDLVDVYTIDSSISEDELKKIGGMLSNPVTQEFKIDGYYSPEEFDWAVEIGFLPGVTDNVGNTAKESVEDLLGRKLEKDEGVYTSQVLFLSGNLTIDDVSEIAGQLTNPLIQRIQITPYDKFSTDVIDIVVPRVKLDSNPGVDEVRILNVSDEELIKIGKQGIEDGDGSRRGPLALDLKYMKTIQDYFRSKGRNPTDVELESVAQTWSEHCKHTIFADPIDEIEEGLYKSFIKATLGCPWRE